MQDNFRKRRAPHHRMITAVVQRIADTENVMPNYTHAGTSTVVARCVVTHLIKQVNFLENYERQRKINLKLFEPQNLKY